MMTVTCTCPECGSAIEIAPSLDAKKAECDICHHQIDVKFNHDHLNNEVRDCPVCERKDFYGQKDFNRKIGVMLFVIAAILSIWTYGISFIVLWLCDLFLFKKLGSVTICYKCQTIFRRVANQKEIYEFNHEMNDRIIYSDHDFQGQQLEH